MSTEADAIEALAGGPERTLKIVGQSLLITPIKTRELPALLRAAQPLIDLMQDAPGEGALQIALLREPDALIDAVAIAARMERAWMDDLALDDLLTLATVTIEVNADFFTRTLAPMISQSADRLTAALDGSISPPG